MGVSAEEERQGLPAFCGVESDGRNSGGGKLKVLRSDNGGCGILYIYTSVSKKILRIKKGT